MSYLLGQTAASLRLAASQAFLPRAGFAHLWTSAFPNLPLPSEKELAFLRSHISSTGSLTGSLSFPTANLTRADRPVALAYLQSLAKKPLLVTRLLLDQTELWLVFNGRSFKAFSLLDLLKAFIPGPLMLTQPAFIGKLGAAAWPKACPDLDPASFFAQPLLEAVVGKGGDAVAVANAVLARLSPSVIARVEGEMNERLLAALKL